MNMRNLPVITLRFLLSGFALTISSLPLLAQDSTNIIDCSTVAKLTRPKSNRIVSLGVINGKAIDLVKPEYPAVARQVHVRGSVQIAILIDTRGCVNEAKALSGHPLLLQASLRAAMQSTFSPTTVSGNLIWVNGVIVYNYLSDSLNWLELGFVSDSPEKLLEYLPPEFDRPRRELKAAKLLSYDERQKAIPAILDMIRVELTTNPKHQWLFDIGRKLNSISKFDWVGPDGLKEILKQLQDLAETAPSTVSPQLVLNLRKLTKETNSTAFWKQMKDIEDRMFHLGN